MNTFQQVEDFVRSRIKSFKHLEFNRFQSPNRPLTGAGAFKVPDNGAWVAWRIDYGKSFLAELADKPMTRRVGELLFYVHVMRGSNGTITLNNLCEELCNHFNYYSNSFFETISATMLPHPHDEKWYIAKVAVVFRVG